MLAQLIPQQCIGSHRDSSFPERVRPPLEQPSRRPLVRLSGREGGALAGEGRGMIFLVDPDRFMINKRLDRAGLQPAKGN